MTAVMCLRSPSSPRRLRLRSPSSPRRMISRTTADRQHRRVVLVVVPCPGATGLLRTQQARRLTARRLLRAQVPQRSRRGSRGAEGLGWPVVYNSGAV